MSFAFLDGPVRAVAGEVAIGTPPGSSEKCELSISFNRIRTTKDGPADRGVRLSVLMGCVRNTRLLYWKDLNPTMRRKTAASRAIALKSDGKPLELIMVHRRHGRPQLPEECWFCEVSHKETPT
jgi:hypothetical protein